MVECWRRSGCWCLVLMIRWERPDCTRVAFLPPFGVGEPVGGEGLPDPGWLLAPLLLLTLCLLKNTCRRTVYWLVEMELTLPQSSCLCPFLCLCLYFAYHYSLCLFLLIV